MSASSRGENARRGDKVIGEEDACHSQCWPFLVVSCHSRVDNVIGKGHLDYTSQPTTHRDLAHKPQTLQKERARKVRVVAVVA